MARCPAGAPLWGARPHVDRGRPQAPASAASASPAATRPPPSPAGTSYLQCGPRDLGEPRRYASYEEWLAKSGSGSTVSRLIELAPSRRRPTDCPCQGCSLDGGASGFDGQERAARGAQAAWARHSHVSGVRVAPPTPALPMGRCSRAANSIRRTHAI